jgi:predicted GNAT family acetyltransferase
MPPTPQFSSVAEFCRFHVPALEQNEVRHNVMLTVLAALTAGRISAVTTWSLGAPGQCATMSAGWPILLADLDETQCHGLAELTAALDFVGVVGPDRTAVWFAKRATELGVKFLAPIPQTILSLAGKPNYPGSPGQARHTTAEDAELLADWITAFMREAIPHDTVPSRERLLSIAGEGRHLFWIVGGRPMSVATIVRRTRNAAAISTVYTPPEFRGRGYAGSVTAALVEQIFSEGRSAACLYADLRNPFSNRCYTKIGFTRVCDSMHVARDLTA